MSEQTPDTNNGVSDGQDPSMEDILASIRQIIAQDDIQAESGVDSAIDIMDTKPLTGDVSGLAQADYLDLDIIEDDIASVNIPDADLVSTRVSAPDSDMMDIEALIGDMDAHGTDDIAAASAGAALTSETPSDEILDLMIPMDEDGLSFDAATDLAVEDILVMEDEIALDPVAAPLAETPIISDVLEDTPEDDLSLMLDNMLEDSQPLDELEALGSDTLVPDESVIEPAEDLLEDIDLTLEHDVPTQAGEADPDMELVKSLMADLTEEPLHDTTIDVVDDIVAIDIDDMDASDGSTDNVLDEILSMTLDDETNLSQEIDVSEIADPIIQEAVIEEAVIQELVTLEPQDVVIEAEPVEALSLKEIAAQAAQDAESSSAFNMGGATALTALGTVGAAAGFAGVETSDADDIEDDLSNIDDELVVETDSPEDIIDTDLIPEEPVILSPEPLIQETPEMATTKKRRAKKPDAIIDEVTETATVGAFASLTNVVEEKATVAERGDRIGDLVQEALRPMLKDWLDANLKGIVERAVTKEVKRISSGK